MAEKLIDKNKKAAIAGGLWFRIGLTLVVFVAGALPRHELANRGAGSDEESCRRSLVGLHVGARGFFAHGANAESDFLFLRVHLDDLELVLHGRVPA